MNFLQDEELYAFLLNRLKTTSEELLHSQSSSWSVSVDMHKLCIIVADILKHGFRFLRENAEPDIWVFIQGLSWLQPSLAASPSFLGHPVSSDQAPVRHYDKAMKWIHKSLENQKLSVKMGWLLSDQEHLLSCYKPAAFLRHPQYSEAALTCLQAVELRQSSLLSGIDEKLYSKKNNLADRAHRRCLSTPTPPADEPDGPAEVKSAETPKISLPVREANTKKVFLKKSFSCSNLKSIQLADVGLSKLTRRNSVTECSRMKDSDSSTRLSALLNVNYSLKSSRTPVLAAPDIVDTSSVASAETVVSATLARRRSFFRLPFGRRDESPSDRQPERRISFVENGGLLSLPITMGAGGQGFRRPTPGQGLINFLSSGAFAHAHAQLDRENAHFNISEAIITTLEQVKCNQQFKLTDEITEESDEEINELKRFIRIRRLQKQKEKYRPVSDCISSETTECTTTTDQSVNSLTSSCYSTSESISTDFDDDDQHNIPNLISSVKSGLSVSKTIVYSDNIINSDDDSNYSISAESVAISLLRRFNENQLPAASDIEWLVSERDAPQKILPIPSSIPVNDEPDDEYLLLRGTSEWAPPRPQIIFTIHPPPVRRSVMEKQHYRCAGCGTRVAQKYASKFRYCEYLGRYFCTSCHSEQSTIIPGRILSKWDFNKYQVSNFSYQLLEQVMDDILFNVMDLNPKLYRQVKVLRNVRSLRFKLYYLKDFIYSCKYTDRLQSLLKADRCYMYSDADSYSLKDLIDIKSGQLFKNLLSAVKSAEEHINSCLLCQARGFFCELCGSKEIIFPWQLDTVVRCSGCGSCCHAKCYKRHASCPKCARIRRRSIVL